MGAFLIVNGREVTVADAVRRALTNKEGSAFLEALVEGTLLRQHAEATGVAVSSEELQRAADEMRYERGLGDRTTALEWVRAHGQTVESLEDQIELLLLRNKAAAQMSDTVVEDYYQAHRQALEYVVLFSIRADTEAGAAGLRARLDAGESFAALACAASDDPATRRAGGFVGRLRRAEMADDIAAAVFDAEIGRPIGPLRTEMGFNLFLVAERRVPTLDEESPGIRLLLFQSVMAGLRATADIRFPPLGSREEAPGT